MRLYPEEKELHERVRLYLNICQRQATPKEAAPQTQQERLYAATLAINGGRYDQALANLRLVRDEDGLQVDFMTAIHGVKSFSGLRARSHAVVFGGHTLWVADLEDILRSKRAAGRPRDKAVLDILEKALNERSSKQKEKTRRPEGGK